MINDATLFQLHGSGLRPYNIPVGGSNGLGTWGYLDAVEELHQQVHSEEQCEAGGDNTVVLSDVAVFIADRGDVMVVTVKVGF